MTLQPAHPRPLWTPPHCPNPACVHHQLPPVNWRFRRRGTYRRATAPQCVPRAQCLACGRLFSQQTFSTTYWLKRPQLLTACALLTVGGMANRQVARALRCAPDTVDRQLCRLGRHGLLFQRQHPLPPSTCRDIVADGLVTFELSQFFPFELLTAVDRDSSFILHFTEAPRRRSGRMTSAQRRQRCRLEQQFGRPDPRAVETAMKELLQQAAQGAQTLIVRTDEHPAYRRALHALACPYRHRTTNSRAPRTCHNELFEVNVLDTFVRHSSANHRRETLAFAKRRQAALERFAVFVVWKNWVKRRREKRCWQTPAMLMGLTTRPWTFAEILAKRLFPALVRLSPRWRQYYWRQVTTPALGVNRGHELKYAQ